MFISQPDHWIRKGIIFMTFRRIFDSWQDAGQNEKLRRDFFDEIFWIE